MNYNKIYRVHGDNMTEFRDGDCYRTRKIIFDEDYAIEILSHEHMYAREKVTGDDGKCYVCYVTQIDDGGAVYVPYDMGLRIDCIVRWKIAQAKSLGMARKIVDGWKKGKFEDVNELVKLCYENGIDITFMKDYGIKLDGYVVRM